MTSRLRRLSRSQSADCCRFTQCCCHIRLVLAFEIVVVIDSKTRNPSRFGLQVAYEGCEEQMMTNRRENQTGRVERMPGRFESMHFLTGQTPDPVKHENRPQAGESARATKRAIRRLLEKFNSARRDAEQILQKLNEISQRISQSTAESHS